MPVPMKALSKVKKDFNVVASPAFSGRRELLRRPSSGLVSLGRASASSSSLDSSSDSARSSPAKLP